MNRLALLTAGALALTVRLAPDAWAAGSAFVNSGNAGDGLYGYHVYGTETNSRGYCLDYNDSTNTVNNTSLGWSLGLERTYGDLYLYNYNYLTGNGANTVACNKTFLRMRGDTGQLTLGPSVSRAADGWQQVAIAAGTSSAPLDGLGIYAYGTRNQLNLGQGNSGSNHTQINQAGKWIIATDGNNNGGLDWYLYDNTLSHQVMYISNADLVSFNYGATVNGTLTVNGPSSLLGSSTTVGASGGLLGFYNSTPVAKPTITGSRSDGSALRSLLQNLQAMGLITDNTTP